MTRFLLILQRWGVFIGTFPLVFLSVTSFDLTDWRLYAFWAAAVWLGVWAKIQSDDPK